MDARFAILAQLPVPEGIPSDALMPIRIPPPFTLQDFLGMVSAVGSTLVLVRIPELISIAAPQNVVSKPAVTA